MINGNKITATCRQHLPKGYFNKRRKSAVNGVVPTTSESSYTSRTSTTLPTSPSASQLSKSVETTIDQLTNQIAEITTFCTTTTTSLPLVIEKPPINIQLQPQPPVITTATKLQQHTKLNACSANESYSNNIKNNNNDSCIDTLNNNYNNKDNDNDKHNYYNNHSNISKFLRSNKQKSFFKLFVIYIIIYTTIFSQSVTFILGNQLDQSRRLENKTNGGEYTIYF